MSFHNDGGKRYGHITTNLSKCMNSILKGARALPICALVNSIFERINLLFVEKGMHARCMLRARHNYPEEVVVMLQENQCHAGMHYVQRYS